MTTPAVAYYRVSTAKQGQSGLGLEAQRAAVLAYARGKDLELSLEFTEVETGTRKRRRPQLEAALDHTRRIGGVLLIAKLDRLARNVAVVATLMESGVRFFGAPTCHHKPEVYGGIGEADASAILKEFFAAKR